MKEIKKYAELLMASVLCVSLGVVSLASAGQKAIGAYTTDSRAATVQSVGTASVKSPEPNLPAPLPAVGLVVAAAGLIVGAYEVGYVLGTIARHASDSWLVDDGGQLALADYNAADFSKFD